MVKRQRNANAKRPTKAKSETQTPANAGTIDVAASADGASAGQPAAGGDAAIAGASLDQANDVESNDDDSTGQDGALNDGQEDGKSSGSRQQDTAASGSGDADASLDAGIPTDAGAADAEGGAAPGAAAGEMTNQTAAEIYGENVFAAAAAAAYASRLLSIATPSVSFTGEDNPGDAMPVFAKAAEFLRQWPEGSAEAVTIHLRMKGFPDVPVPGPRELAAWKVFAFTLITLDQVDADEAAAKLAAEPPPAPAIWPGDRALQPQPGAFDPSGFSLRR